MKRFLGLTAVALLALTVASATFAAEETVAGKCMTCHKDKSPGLYRQWQMSTHAMHNITCLDCHAAAKGDADAFMHEGGRIATLVTPKDCGKCHEKEAAQTQDSYHAHAGEILESNDAYLAHAAGGMPVVIQAARAATAARSRSTATLPTCCRSRAGPIRASAV